MKKVLKILILLLIIAIIFAVAYLKQVEYERGFDNASKFFDIRNEIKNTIVEIGYEENFSVALDEYGHVNEDGTDFVYDGKDRVAFDYVLNFSDGCTGSINVLYYQRGALLNAYVMNSQDDKSMIDRELKNHTAAMTKIGNAFAKYEVKEKDLQDIVLSNRYSAELFDFEFEDNFLRNYYEPNPFNNYEYTQSESYISDKKYFEELAIECYMKDMIE